MKVTNGNATEFWSISTFSDTVREELSGLQDGDSVSVVGALSVELFEWKGEQRISRKLLQASQRAGSRERISMRARKSARPRDSAQRASSG